MQTIMHPTPPFTWPPTSRLATERDPRAESHMVGDPMRTEWNAQSIEIHKHFEMPSALSVRREHAYRPQVFSSRHRMVAELLSKGYSQKSVAHITGYSVSHISRIVGMPETRRTIARLLAARAVDIFATRRRLLAEFCRR